MKIEKIISAALAMTDNWSPTTCPLEELAEHVGDLEQIEELIARLAGRAIYLRGVMDARILETV